MAWHRRHTHTHLLGPAKHLRIYIYRAAESLAKVVWGKERTATNMA